MLGATIVSLLFYDYLFIRYHQKLLPPQKRRVIPLALTLAAIVAISVLLNLHNLIWLSIPLSVAVMTGGLFFSASMSLLQAFFGAGLCTLGANIFLIAFSAINTLLFGAYTFFSYTWAHLPLHLLAIPCALAFFALFRNTFFPDRDARRLYCHKAPLQFACVYVAVAVLNLSLIQTGYGLCPHNPYVIAMALAACLLALFLLTNIMYQSIQNEELSECKWQKHLLEEQYDRQLRHYQFFQEDMECVQVFSHDLKPLMLALKALIRSREYDEALQMIDDLYADMPKRARHRRYSSNVILDSLLQDAADTCQAQQIRFSAHISLPRHLDLSTLDSIRIFSNIITNALQACLNVPLPNRFVEISCHHKQQWVVFEVANSYDGQLREENGRLLTTKTDRHGHGLGMRILTEIVEHLGGFVFHHADSATKTFLIRVHIPQPSLRSERDAPEAS